MSKKPSPNFDDTRQYKDDRDSKKEVKEYCSTCGEVHGSKCPEYYTIHREEPKLECDHIVGHYDNRDSFTNVRLSYLSPKEYLEAFEWFRDFSSKEDREIDTHYNYCPECGYAINWDAIEKQIKQKKDD